MCQPKPGPRCSGHARTALEARRTVKDATEAARDTAQAAFRACDPADRETREHLRAAAVTADKTYWEATNAHTIALREYETTPEGMAALEQAAATFDEEGNQSAADEVRRRLDEARATRAQQVADLAMSRRHAARLTNPTVEELAALDQADAEVADKERELAVRSDAYRDAHEQWQTLSVAAREADRIDADANRAYTDTFNAAVEARSAAEAEARRLYVEAGVSDKFAAYYAADMAAAASRTETRPRFGYDRYSGGRVEDQGPQRPMSVKVKRDGADRDKTLAAKAAAETDEAFMAANARLATAAADLKSAKDALTDVRRTETGPIRERVQQALSAAGVAKYAMEDAATDRDTARARRADLRARIGSGLGPAPISAVAMQRVGDEIVRNPDGTTNAYVYNGPSDGFPDGRYIPAVGVTEVHGMAPANALVLENGAKAWLHGHYARTTRGAGETQSGYQKVVIVPAQPGATPLRGEAVATAGYYTFIDSSD